MGHALACSSTHSEGRTMGVLLITCPVTGKEFSTGIQPDRKTSDALPKVTTRSRCPYCKTDHPWQPRDARYAEAIPPSTGSNARPEADFGAARRRSAGLEYASLRHCIGAYV